ncbi:MAG TPA: hypothetical protein PLR07_15515 [Promineifilum sp.]|nr:hypothetical protein [Promineifilum sp.]
MSRFATTAYFESVRSRPDRSYIRDEWIQRVIENPIYEVIQEDGRIRRWAAIEELEGRFLRVVLLEDGHTVHNAFLDRRFRGKPG